MPLRDRGELMAGGGAIGVVDDPVRVCVLAGQEARAGRRAQRRGHERVSETGSFTRKAIEFIDANRSRPFLLYVAQKNVHIPLLPSPEFALEGVYARGPVAEPSPSPSGARRQR